MKSKFFTLALLVLLSSTTFGQAFTDLTWHVKSSGVNHESIGQFYSGPNGQMLLFGGFSGDDVEIAGTTLEAKGSTGQGDAYLTLIDSSGTATWTETFGSPALLFIDMAVTMDYAGDIYISGGFFSNRGPLVPYEIDFFDTTIAVNPNSNGSYPFYAKVNGNGNVVWLHEINSPGFLVAKSLDLDAAGNIYLGGSFNSWIKSGDSTFYAFDTASTSIANDFFLLKMDGDGNHQWLKTFGSRERNTSLAMSVSTNGDVYASGTWTGDTLFVGSKFIVNPNPQIGKNANGWHAKFNANGQAIWLVRHSDEDAVANKIMVNPVGGFVTTGYINDKLTIDGTTYGTGYIILRYDEDGAFQSAFHVDGPVIEELFPGSGFYYFPLVSLTLQDDGGITFGLNFMSETQKVGNITIENNAGDFGSNDALFAKINSENKVEWVHHIGGPESEIATNAAYYNDNILLVGATTSPSLVVTENIKLTNSGALTQDVFILSYKNKILSTPDVFEISNINLYPNPTQDIVLINLKSFKGAIAYQLIDATGKAIDAQQLSGGGIVEQNLSDYPSGIYYISISSESMHHVERLVVK